MIETILSINKVLIRLSDERWSHITEEHSELAGMKYEILETVTNPEKILLGKDGELIAVRMLKDTKYLVVVYREINNSDGFVITAFITRRINYFNKRVQVWPNH